MLTSDNELKGSFISCEGEAIGVAAVDAVEPFVRVGLAEEGVEGAADRRLNETCRMLDLLEGEARRERVLRKADLRFGGGGGSAETSIGR